MTCFFCSVNNIKFGGVPNGQGAHAVFQLGKTSFKKEKSRNRIVIKIDFDIGVIRNILKHLAYIA